MYPPIGPELLECCQDGGSGPVRVLGNTWRAWEAPAGA
jgi:hypothetical protein